MTQTGLFIYKEQLFGKGYNDKVPPEFIPKGYLADALNAVITEDRIEKRTGYSLVGNDTGNKPILGLCGITTSSGTKRLYKFHNNSADTAIEIYEWTGSGNWTLLNNTLLTGVGNRIECVVAENVVYAYDGASTPVKITPASPSTVAAVPDSNHPKGKFGKWFHNFHFVSGVTANPNRLYWSELGDSDDFTNTTTGSLDVNPDDGDEITGMGVLKDELLVFKRNRVWSLTGFGTSTFTLADVNERITGFGTPSYRSIVNVGNDVYYLSHTGGVPEFRSIQRTRFGTIVEGGIVSDDIYGTMKGLNNAQLDEVAGIFDGRRVFYAIPLSGSTVNNQIQLYDTVNKGWVRWTGLPVGVWTEFNFSNTSEIYFGGNGSDSLVFKLDTTTNDNGTAISFRVDTRRYGGDRPEIKKRWKYLYTTVDKEGAYNLTVQQSPDGFTFDSLASVDLSGTDGTLPLTLDTDRLGTSDVKKERSEFAKKTSYFNQLRFLQEGLDQTVTIRDWEILYKLRGLRDA